MALSTLKQHRWVSHLACLGVAAMALGCNKDDASWSRYNQDGDIIEVQVGAAEEGEVTIIDLLSSTGNVVVGAATVSPGSGPLGTEHDLSVVIEEDYEASVGKVTVHVDSGSRGAEEIDFVRDSADHGFWWLQISSNGSAGESRTDTFEFWLWTDDSSESESE